MEEKNNNLDEMNTSSSTTPEVVLEPAVDNPTGVEQPANEVVEPVVQAAVTPQVETTVDNSKPEPAIESPQASVTPGAATPTPTPTPTLKAKGKKTGIIVALVAIILLIVAMVGFWVFAGDKIIFEKNIDRLMAKLKVTELENQEFKKGLISTKTSVDTSSSFLLPQMQYDINADISVDFDKNLMNIALDIANDEDNFIAELIAKEKGLFAKFDVISDKIFIIDSDFTNEFDDFELNDFSAKDYNKIITYLNRAINTNVDRDDLTKEKAKIFVNDKEYNAKKISYLIDEEELKDIAITFLTSIKDDKKLLKTFSSDTDKIKKELEEAIKELKEEDLDEDIKATYSVYMNGFTALRHEVVLEEDDEKIFVLYDMYNEDKKSVEKLTINFEHDENMFEMIVKNTAKDKYEIEIDITDVALIKGKYEKTSKKLNLEFDVLLEDEKIAQIKLSSSVESKDKSKAKLEFTSELLGIELISDITVDKSKKVKDINVSKAIELDEIDEDDYLSLEEKITKLFGPLLGSEDDYDDYYDDDDYDFSY